MLEEASTRGEVRIRRGDGREFVLRPASVAGPAIGPDGLCVERQRDLSDIAGTWVEDPGFDEAMADQDRVDPKDWE